MKTLVLMLAGMIALSLNVIAEPEAKPAPAIKNLPENTPRMGEVENVKKGDKIIDFEYADLGGISHKTEDLRKGKYFILSFIKDPGRDNAAENTSPLNALAKHFEEKVAILELAILEKIDEKTAIAFYEKTAPVYTPAFDFEGKIAAKYGVKNTPLIIVFNDKGEVVIIYHKYAKTILIQRAIEDEINGVPAEQRF